MNVRSVGTIIVTALAAAELVDALIEIRARKAGVSDHDLSVAIAIAGAGCLGLSVRLRTFCIQVVHWR